MPSKAHTPHPTLSSRTRAVELTEQTRAALHQRLRGFCTAPLVTRKRIRPTTERLRGLALAQVQLLAHITSQLLITPEIEASSGTDVDPSLRRSRCSRLTASDPALLVEKAGGQVNVVHPTKFPRSRRVENRAAFSTVQISRLLAAEHSFSTRS